MTLRPEVVGIVGGSCSGKTWLASRLARVFGDLACRISLDDFYQDRSRLSPADRKKCNYDHPSSIDWDRFESVLKHCLAQTPTTIPHYDFATHSRMSTERKFQPKPIIIVDGLWLFLKSRIRKLFDFRIFLECLESTRFARRLHRDVSERGRSQKSIEQQFKNDVSPMHHIFVEPQEKWAHLIVDRVLTDDDLIQLWRPLNSFFKLRSFGCNEDFQNPQDRKVSIHE